MLTPKKLFFIKKLVYYWHKEMPLEKNNKKCILIVEDEISYANLLKTELEKNGFEAEVCRTGDNAIECINKRVPDLILLDLILPGKSGYDVLETFQNTKTLKDTKVFVLSNLSQGYEVEKAFELGAFDFVVKTETSLKDLIERIRKLLL